jgi:hypothetical protein
VNIRDLGGRMEAEERWHQEAKGGGIYLHVGTSLLSPHPSLGMSFSSFRVIPSHDGRYPPTGECGKRQEREDENKIDGIEDKNGDEVNIILFLSETARHGLGQRR